MDIGEAFTLAEAKRKNGNFQEACELFKEIWDSTGIPRSGCGYAHCLRKTGRPEEAALIAREVMEKYPKVTWALNELIWSLFQGDLKKARESGDLELMDAVAEEIFSISNDDLSKRLTFFVVADTYRHKMKWESVVRWCEKVNPEVFPIEKPVPEEKHKGISERERYYYAKTRALMSLGQWDEARKACREAQALFPRKSDFPRWAARARGEAGDIDGALEEFTELLRRYRREWYIDAERAELFYRKGDRKAALELACTAAMGRGELKTKVNVIHLLARILHDNNDDATALVHIRFAKDIRAREQWSIPRELLDLEFSVQKALKAVEANTETSDSFEKARDRCREFWARNAERQPQGAPTRSTQSPRVGEKEHEKRTTVTSGVSDAPKSHQPKTGGATLDGRHSGKLLTLNKNFGFIKPDGGGESVFVLIQDIPKEQRSVGTHLTYSLKSNFDHKKGKDSVRAVAVKAG